jgi:hypothetical protein
MTLRRLPCRSLLPAVAFHVCASASHAELTNPSPADLWLRTAKTPARARFTLIADAFTTNQVVSVSSLDTQLRSRWQAVDLPLESFPKLPASHVDRFTIEFVSDAPNEFFVDDVQLLGPWKQDSQ